MMNIINRLFSVNRNHSTNTIPNNKHSKQLVTNPYEALKHLYNIDQFLNQLSNIVGLPEKHFKVLYETPIRLLACRLQHIPASTTNTNPALMVKLAQIIKGMKYRESFIMPSGVSPEEINLKKDVWRFATFYSLLLVDLGPTLTAHSVKYNTDRSEQDCVWNPFGNLIPVNTIINYIPHRPLDNASSLIFSPLIFSSASIDWLNHESCALNYAIAAILGTHDTQTLTQIVNSTLSTTKPMPIDKPQVTHTAERFLVQKKPITVLDHGNLFFDWFREGIEKNNQIVLALTMRVDTGIAFKTPMIFKSYAKETECEWKTVRDGFNKLKISRKLTDMNGKSIDMFNLSKSNNDQWSIIESTYFSITPGISKKIDFFDWLMFILKFQINHYLEEKPSYIITSQYIYLVIPHVFNIYASMHNVSEKGIEGDFLSLGIHIKNNGSDYFKYTLDNNETMNTLKLKRSLEFYPQI